MIMRKKNHYSKRNTPKEMNTIWIDSTKPEIKIQKVMYCTEEGHKS